MTEPIGLRSLGWARLVVTNENAGSVEYGIKRGTRRPFRVHV